MAAEFSMEPLCYTECAKLLNSPSLILGMRLIEMRVGPGDGGMKNRLYYGDNLDILRNREYFPDECVDLID